MKIRHNVKCLTCYRPIRRANMDASVAYGMVLPMLCYARVLDRRSELDVIGLLQYLTI